MSETPVVQDWLGALADPAARSQLCVRRHVQAETTADVDTICATVSQDVFFAVPVRTRAGQEIPDGAVLTHHDAVRDYYAGRADSYVVLASRQLKSVASGWYVFNESAATLRGTGRIGELDATGREFVVQSAILFPTADDGIRGEICITRHPFEDVVAGRRAQALDAGALARAEMDRATLLDRMLEPLRGGEATALESLMAPDHCLAIRVDAPEAAPAIKTATRRAPSAAALGSLFEGASDVAVVSRVASSWYLFVEYIIRLESGAVGHVALLHSIDAGTVSGSFGYGWYEAAPDASDDLAATNGPLLGAPRLGVPRAPRATETR